MTTRERLMRKALDWPSPHVRRQAHRIGTALEALDRAGIPYEAISSRRIVVGPNKRVIARYDHPNRTPVRAHGAIVFEHRIGPNSVRGTGQILRIDTLDELADFVRDPQRALGVPL